MLSLVFAFELDDRIIGTIRMTPAIHDITLTEKLLAGVAPDFRERWPGAWDAGRLVLLPEYRAGQEVLRRCLHLITTYLIQYTDCQTLVGSCIHVLGRLYRRIGFTLVAQNVPLEGTNKSYTLIQGPLTRVHTALAPQGALLS